MAPLVFSLVVFLAILTVLGFWLGAVIGVALDVKQRDPKNAPLWLAFVLLTGPLAVFAYALARPELPHDPE